MVKNHSARATRTGAGSDTDPDGPLTHIHEHPEIESKDLDAVERMIAPSVRILDIGAGRGGFVLQARKRGHAAWALDLQAAAAPIWRRQDVPGVVADAYSAPFPNDTFDVVRLKEVLEHVQDPLGLIRAVRPLARERGCIIAHVPSPYSQLYPVGNFWDDYTHVRPLSKLGLRRLFEDAQLSIVSIEGYTAGRNPVERAIGGVLARVLPHTYRVIARGA